MTAATGTQRSGGHAACSAGDVYRTATPDLYRCTLVGVRRLTIPVRPGTYGVTLLFAETRGEGPGRRVFDVEAEDRPVVTGLDVVARVGPREAYHVVAATPVRDGALDLDFRVRRGQSILSAVEVSRLGASVAPPRPVWADEFAGPAGTRPDSRSWTHEVGGGGWGNDELQTYTRSRTNAALDGDGHLAIVARRREPGAEPGGFTSARLTTKGRVDVRYGAVEARIKVPPGQGLWPAFWALGIDLPRDSWPASGEIDLMEVIGSEPKVVHAGIHGPDEHDGPYTTGGAARNIEPLDRAFHVYGARWIPGAIQFELDGRPYATVVQADLRSGQRWVFDAPFFLLLNIAVGGTWPGPPDGTTAFPATMLVDWVRVTR